MAAVTQTITNYLGGVSKQTDEKKIPGQVRECLNAVPDPPFGLMKRPGLKFSKTLSNVVDASLADANWFYINRDGDEKYIGRISAKVGSTNGNIKIWNVATGVECDIHLDAGPWAANTAYIVDDVRVNGANVYKCTQAGTSAGSGGPTGTGSSISDGAAPNTVLWDYVRASASQDYLTTTRENYHVLTVQDTTFVTNKTKVIEAQPVSSTFNPKKVGTVHITVVNSHTLYEVLINGKNTWDSNSGPNTRYRTREGENPNVQWDHPNQHLNVDDILSELKKGLEKLEDIGGRVQPTKLASTLELEFFSRKMTYKDSPVSGIPANHADHLINVATTATDSGGTTLAGAVATVYNSNGKRDMGVGTTTNTTLDKRVPGVYNISHGTDAATGTTCTTSNATGINATWQITVQDDGQVRDEDIKIINRGSGFAVYDAISCDSALLGGPGGSPLTWQIGKVVEGLTVSVKITNGAVDNAASSIYNFGNVGYREGDLVTAVIPVTNVSPSPTVRFTLGAEYLEEFTLGSNDDSSNKYITHFQGEIKDVAETTFQSIDGRYVKVTNTNADEDNYWLKFYADNGVSGDGKWEESRDPAASPGLVAASMPHELLNTAPNEFVFKPFEWNERETGDSVTNPDPTFVGKTIQQGFYHNNRLGFLSEDNVIMSQSGDVDNFFFTSALSSTDADPIDLSCSSIRPAKLHAIIPTAQGLILFSTKQQFIMFSDTEILTPSTTVIRAVSNFEMDPKINPVDIGTSISFVSKTPSYTRVYGATTRGSQETPLIYDVGKIVSEWIPNDVTELIASPQNSLIALYGNSLRDMYIYKTYQVDEKNLMQAWVKWTLPGTIQFATIDQDYMYSVVRNGNSYDLLKASMTQTPDEEIIVTSDGKQVNPHMDFYAVASSVKYLGIDTFTITAGGTGYTSAPTVSIAAVDGGTGATATATISSGAVTGITLTAAGSGYDAGAVVSFSGGGGSNAAATCTVYDGSKCYLPYADVTTLTPVLVIAGESNFASVTESGFTISPERGNDGNPYFKVPRKDLSQSSVIVGYKYNYDIELPKTYYKTDEEGAKSDFTANLTIARMKFSVGLSSVLGFKVKSKGYRGEVAEFTGDGSTKAFKVPFLLKEENGIRVTLDGALQPSTAYSVTRTVENGVTIDNSDTVTFNTAPTGSSTAANVTTPAQKIEITTDTWYDVQPVQEAGYYLSDDVPLVEDNIFTIPLHQRTDNFNLRLFSNSPFPVAVNSMMWEGNYSPRFYRRV